MKPERIALGVLTLIAIVMGVNYVSATARFLDANRAYDGLTLALEEFSFVDAESPVPVAISVTNPSGSDIDVMSLRVTLRAGLQTVGNGEIYVEDRLLAGETLTYRIDATIMDRNVVRRLQDEPINWLLRGAVQVQLDERVPPVWIEFSVRTISS